MESAEWDMTAERIEALLDMIETLIYAETDSACAEHLFGMMERLRWIAALKNFPLRDRTVLWKGSVTNLAGPM